LVGFGAGFAGSGFLGAGCVVLVGTGFLIGAATGADAEGSGAALVEGSTFGALAAGFGGSGAEE
jgi:hypothetical protein